MVQEVVLRAVGFGEKVPQPAKFFLPAANVSWKRGTIQTAGCAGKKERQLKLSLNQMRGRRYPPSLIKVT